MNVWLFLETILVLAKKSITFMLSERKGLTGQLICLFAYFQDMVLLKYFIISGRVFSEVCIFTIHKQQSDMVAFLKKT